MNSNDIIHVIAICCDCAWRSEDYGKGVVLAREHAKKFKHKVNVEMAHVKYFDYREKDLI